MYYINREPNESGNHGNPTSSQAPGMLALPEELLEDYIKARGFVTLTIEVVEPPEEETPDQEPEGAATEPTGQWSEESEPEPEDEAPESEPVEIITALTVNREALEAYEAEHPDMPEPEKVDLAAENKLLKAQIQAQSDRTDFLEDCIAEMAGVVYG